MFSYKDSFENIDVINLITTYVATEGYCRITSILDLTEVQQYLDSINQIDAIELKREHEGARDQDYDYKLLRLLFSHSNTTGDHHPRETLSGQKTGARHQLVCALKEGLLPPGVRAHGAVVIALLPQPEQGDAAGVHRCLGPVELPHQADGGDLPGVTHRIRLRVSIALIGTRTPTSYWSR